MSAVQRWYIYSTGPVEADKCIIIPESPPQKWVRDEDVHELERVIDEQSAKHKVITDGLRARVEAKDKELLRLKEYEWMYKDLQS